MSDDRLESLLKRAVEKMKAMSPDERAEMLAAQRRSWAIGELMLEHEGLSYDEAARRVDIALEWERTGGHERS